MTFYIPHTGDVNPSHEGPRDSKLLVLAESPWWTEVKLQRPLCGDSGHKWEEWLMKAGLLRSQLRIENLYPFVPPTRKITSVSDAKLSPWFEDLHRRIAQLPNLNCIATMGNYATYALTGKGKVRSSLRNSFSSIDSSMTEAEKKAGISSLRGSIYQYEDLNGRKIKVVPTIHPADVLQYQKWEKRTVCDWKRIAKEMQNSDYEIIKRNHIVDPSEWEVERFVRFVENDFGELPMATDIETWGRTLSCVGFAVHAGESITIPTASKDQQAVFLPYIKRLCESRTQKVLCNGFYDWYWLDDYRIQLFNYIWDIQLMHHAFDPVESHSLEFLASVFTKQRYWKDEAKDAEEIVKYAKKLESLWVYNGLDCCVTIELLPVLYKILEKRGLVDFYFRHYVQMIEPLLRMMRNGVRVDKKRQKEWRKKLQDDLVGIRKELEDAAGENLFAVERKTFLRKPTASEWEKLLGFAEFAQLEEDLLKGKHIPASKDIHREGRQLLIDEQGCTYMIGGKNAGMIRAWKEIEKKTFAPKKLKRFFNETLGLPKQQKRRKNGKFTATIDEGALRKMTAKWPNKIGNYGNLLIAYREKEREINYLKGAWDPDGRIRCSYKMITEAGRLASSKNPMGRGYNMQNLKR